MHRSSTVVALVAILAGCGSPSSESPPLPDANEGAAGNGGSAAAGKGGAGGAAGTAAGGASAAGSGGATAGSAGAAGSGGGTAGGGTAGGAGAGAGGAAGGASGSAGAGGVLDPSTACTNAGPGSVLFLSGEAGDVVHPGAELVTGATWSTWNLFQNSGGFDVVPAGQTAGHWNLEFGTGTQQLFAVGVPTPAGTKNAGGAWLSVSGFGHGCGSVDGAYAFQELTKDGAGKLATARIVFEQRCEGSKATLRGCLRYAAP